MALRLGEILLSERRITPAQLQAALDLQRQQGGKIGTHLVALGCLTDDDVTAFVSKQYSVPSIALSQFEIDPGIIRLVPVDTARKYEVLPLCRTGATLTIAMTDPTNVFAMDDIKFMTGYNVEPVVASESSVLAAIAHYYQRATTAPAQVVQVVPSALEAASKALEDMPTGTGDDVEVLQDHPFVALNCGAVPETLLESELFGHMRGAFTGADTNKKGLLEAAERGTVFLDEIGEMSATMQVKFLRVLQERRFRRVGGTEEVPVDVRVVAATHRDLPALVAEGRFREDLFYRIDVIALRLPPLRERRDDVPLLADMFLEKFAAEMQRPVRTVSREAQEFLAAYHWPGNVRELENVIERGVALERSPVLLPEALPPHIRGAVVPPAATMSSVSGSAFPPLTEGFNLEACGDELYRHYLAEALDKADGVQVKAAELVGMSFRSFRYYAKKFHLT